MSLEQEVKLLIKGTQRPDLDALPWLNALVDSRDHSHLRTDYFDTPELALQQMGLALRLRELDGQWLQTVKSQGTVSNGLHQREEWEHPLPNAAFDLALLRQTPLLAFAEDSGRWKQLRCLFTTEFDRQIYRLIEGETEIELAYDSGEVRSEGLTAPIHEIELELRHGDLTVLNSVAEKLKNALGLEYNPQSKAAIGYQLFRQHQS